MTRLIIEYSDELDTWALTKLDDNGELVYTVATPTPTAVPTFSEESDDHAR